MSDSNAHISSSTTRRLLIPAAVLTLLAALSAGAQTVNQKRPYSGTITNPCNGETVAFSGTIHFHEKTQVSGDQRIHFVANNNFNASGTGQTTGLQYSLGGTMQVNSKFPTYPIMFRQRTKVISNGAASNFHATFVFHVNGKGEPTRTTTESDCTK